VLQFVIENLATERCFIFEAI